jgi:hypothetical protein
MKSKDDEINRSLTTFEGARREQLRRNLKLSLHDRLLALEKMESLSMALRGDRYPEVVRQSRMSVDEQRAEKEKSRAGWPQAGHTDRITASPDMGAGLTQVVVRPG